MNVLTALYGLKDKAGSLTGDDRTFVCHAIELHENGIRRLSPQEMNRVLSLNKRTESVKAVCHHPLQAPVVEYGEPTEHYECILCRHRF